MRITVGRHGLALAVLACCASCGNGGDRATSASFAVAVADATKAASLAAPAPTAPTRPLPMGSGATARPAPGLLPPTPLQAIFRDLNSNTAATASGEYTILQELSKALRSRLDQLLKSLSR